MIESSTGVAVALTASFLDQTLLAQIGEQRDDVALDCALRIGKAIREPHADRVLVAAGLYLAHDGRRRRVQRVHLFASRLEEDAAELLFTELHVLGKAHRLLPLPVAAPGPTSLTPQMVRKSPATCHRPRPDGWVDF